MSIKERPILFSGPMVRAILDGRKTQTRRIVKGRGNWLVSDAAMVKWPYFENEDGTWSLMRCPYGIDGDQLWVRETFMASSGEIAFAATDQPLVGCEKWKPSIFMPRWASRITLEITGVRVERLQDISESDAIAEGIESQFSPTFGDTVYKNYEDGQQGWSMYALASYRSLWSSINGPDSWAANPFVWVIEFRRVEQ